MFFDNFGLLADAPNGVQKLHELILQLAVQGKLVPQDPDDEPAAVLLEKIKAEKERLVKEKKIRKSKPLPPVEIDEIRFKIPDSWKWIRLNQIGDWGAGATPNRKKSEYYGGYIRWLKSGELRDGYVSESDENITESALKDCSLRINKCGDVLIAMYGATIGKVAILEVEATTNQAVCACTCFAGFYNRYLFLLLKSYRQYFSNQGAGGAQPNISRIKIISTVAPLPPLNEQKRIVAKVDQLMALCDKLEARQQKKQEARLHLNSAALDRLLTAHEPDKFAHPRQRVCGNFDLLYDAPETVGELRKAILQLAVQGKLVRQDANDVPAAVLLEKIRDEKARLMKEKKIKVAKELPSIEGDELPYVLPKEWEWTRLSEITEIIMGNSPPGNTYNEKSEGVPLINGPVEFSEGPFGRTIKSKFTTKPTKFCEEGDLLICVRGSTTGRTNVAGFKACIGRGVAVIRSKVHQPYINYFILSMRQQIYDLGTGSTFPSISQKHLMIFLVPLPPLNEQRRIVAKVDQLMALCDELESKLKQSQTDGTKLMDAVVHQLVEA